MARRRRRGLADAASSVTWRTAKAPRGRFADGPRQVADVGKCRLEVYDDCSNKRGTCPASDFTYVITKGGDVKAAGPHSGRRAAGYFTTIDEAKNAAVKRFSADGSVRRRCR